MSIVCVPISLVSVVHIEDASGHYKIPSAAAALNKCEARGMRLATRVELEYSRKLGLDVCACGWLADGTVGYPIVTPRKWCGEGPPGVRTCPVTPSSWGRIGWDAYCATI